MVRRVLRWVLWTLAGLLGLLVLALVVAFAITEIRVRQTYEVEVAPIPIPTDAVSIEYGRHIATTWGACTACHGDQLEGQIFIDDAMMGRITTPNLTTGEGGLGSFSTDEDWIRAIRHGIKRSKRSNVFMFGSLHRLSDEELGAVIAWARSLPPVDNVVPDISLGPMSRLFVLLEPDIFLPARVIDHDALPIPVPPPGPTAAYGEHMARSVCVECHQHNFVGGFEVGGTDGVGVVARNLTPAGDIGNWTEADFVAVMRTGITPAGEQLDVEAMPYNNFSGMTDEELHAMWLFLQTLPPAQP